MIELDAPPRPSTMDTPPDAPPPAGRPRRAQPEVAGRRAFLALAVVALAASPAVATLLAAPAAVRLAPPPGTTAWQADARHLPDPLLSGPAAVRAFLAGASPAERQALVDRYPGVVGALDGAPLDLRYAANQAAMRAAGGTYAEHARTGQYLLFDPRGNGRVAEVFGDLATADRIAVLIPGASNRAANFWTGVGDRAYRAPATQAGNLYRASAGLVPGGRLAVIAWLGYDAPQGADLSQAREDLARAGAAELRRLVAGLTTLRPHATIAVLGHSYGSTVAGLAAARLPRQVTDIAVFASPGMGVRREADLHTRARVWAGQSARDPIRWVPNARLFGLGHGTKPADPSFGARTFPTHDVPDHDHYLATGTDSLTALAHITATGALQ